MEEKLPSTDAATQRSESPSIHTASSSFGLVQSDRVFLVAISLCCLALLGVKWWNAPSGRQETIEIRHLQQAGYLFQIDINTATWVEWMQLDGIGETTARNIVENRKADGPFVSVNDVQRIRGIGSKTLEKMRLHLACESCVSEDDKHANDLRENQAIDQVN